MLVAATLVASVTLVQCFTRPSTNVYMLLLLPTSLAASSFLNVHLSTLPAVSLNVHRYVILSPRPSLRD